MSLIHGIVSWQEKDDLGIRTSHRHKVDASDIIGESGDKLSDDIFKLFVIKVSLDKGETCLTKLRLFEIGFKDLMNCIDSVDNHGVAHILTFRIIDITDSDGPSLVSVPNQLAFKQGSFI